MRNRFVTVRRLPTLVAAASLALTADDRHGTGGSLQGATYRPTASPISTGFGRRMNTANWDIEAHPAGPSPVRELGAISAVPAGLGIVEGGELPYKPEALAKKKENLANRLKLDPGDQVLPARRAARHVHAVPVSDHPEPEAHHDDVRICGRGAHGLHGQPDRGPGRQLDGLVERPLGRGNAGDRHQRLQRLELVRPGRQFPQRRAARRRTNHRAQPGDAHVRSDHRGSRMSSRDPGRSACRSTGTWRRTRRSWNSGAWNSSKI